MKRFDEKCLLMREADEYFGDPRKDLNIKVAFELKTLYNKSAFSAYCAYVTAYWYLLFSFEIITMPSEKYKTQTGENKKAQNTIIETQNTIHWTQNKKILTK